MKIVIAAATAALLIASGNAHAAFSWGLKSFEISGSETFYDDFEDGSLAVPPTSQIFLAGNVATETGGQLLFTDADGWLPHPDVPGLGYDVIQVGNLPDFDPPFIVDGQALVHGSFDADIEGLIASPESSGYWIQVFNNPGTDGAFLFALSDGLGNAGVLFTDENYTIISGQPLLPGIDTLDLFLQVDTEADQITAWFAADGTLTVLPGSTGLVGGAVALAGGSGPVVVPLPPAVVLMLPAVAGVALASRRPARTGE